MNKVKKESDYYKVLEQNDKEWEDLCIRCGGCCGAFDDPCLYLKKDKDSKTYCEIYAYRLGIQKTVKGEEFKCVPVKEIIYTHWKNDHLCSCKRRLRGF